MSAKTVLIISFSYWPADNPRAYRWTSLAEEFVQKGIRVWVVTALYPGSPERENRKGVLIHRVGNRWIEQLRTSLSRRRTKEQTINPTHHGRYSSSILQLIRKLWRWIAWPDTTCVWYRAAVRKSAELLLEAPEATVVSVSPTFTAVLVGHALTPKRKGYWIIDLGDPFSLAVESPPNNFVFYQLLNRYIERKVFLVADRIVLTNRIAQAAYINLYPTYKEKMSVVPPLLSAIFSGKSQVQSMQQSANAVRLAYVGTLYRKLRRPDYLLHLFENLQRIWNGRRLELHMYGKFEECIDAFTAYKEQIGRTVFLHGQVDRLIALEAIRSASLAINLGNTNSLQLPSKLVEYMALGKPILNLVQVKADPSLEFLTDTPWVLTLVNDSVSSLPWQTNQLAEFLKEIERGVVHRDNNVFELDTYAASSVAAKYEQILFS